MQHRDSDVSEFECEAIDLIEVSFERVLAGNGKASSSAFDEVMREAFWEIFMSALLFKLFKSHRTCGQQHVRLRINY
jgi:hypothetical protein